MADRKLAAIMFTDIAGYTRLMGDDEEKAFEVLKINREIHETQMSKYGGEKIKEIGDGILASFSSAYQAVLCAMAIQQEAFLENIILRIGIHEADIVFENGDVLGDGVNIAFRLQETAEKGGIAISGTVYHEIKNKSNIKTGYIGEKNLKHVKHPIKIYKIINPGQVSTIADAPQRTGKTDLNFRNYLLAGMVFFGAVFILIAGYFFLNKRPEPDRINVQKSIAVRPFWNESPDQENEYFLNGMAEEIRINLSKISDLRVVSRGSMEKYRGSTLSTREITMEENVNYVLEGSGQKIGDHLRVHIQLIYVSDEEDHIWQETYEREIVDVKDIFIIQQEVAEIVAKELYATLSPEEKNNIESNPTTNLTAYDFYLQAREAHINFWMAGINPVGLEIISNEYDELETAIRNYRRALEYDPTFARAYTGLALAYRGKYWDINMLEEDYLDTLFVLAEKALSYDSNLDEGYYVRGLYFQFGKGDLIKALTNYRKALEINPGYAEVYRQAGNMYSWELNDYINGIFYLTKAIELDRGYLLPYTLNTIGNSYLLAGFDNQALDYFQQSFEISDDTSGYYWNLAFREWSMGNIEKSIEKAEEGLGKDSSAGRLIEFLAIRNSFIGNTKEAYEYLMKIRNLPDQEDSLNLWFNGNHRIAYILWENGQKELSRSYFNLQIQILQKLIELNRAPSQRGLAQYDIAAIYAFREQYDSAFYYLKEVGKRETYPAFLMTYFKYDPLTENIRNDPRFQAFLQQAEIKFQRKHDELEAWLKEEGLL